MPSEAGILLKRGSRVCRSAPVTPFGEHFAGNLADAGTAARSGPQRPLFSGGQCFGIGPVRIGQIPRKAGRFPAWVSAGPAASTLSRSHPPMRGTSGRRAMAGAAIKRKGARSSEGLLFPSRLRR
ncbi:MAG: hypothetical protein C6P37_07130 [Caldibacillus debilis]|uniref:Uncharacterized protein n=1 Tax=Caldibacillus debilis TaxID=301148 RepID=A0A3E0K5S0_9BACI|nr:MAG: hypothetical protein C6P37_07130 [Caldibacillus debilis]